MEPTSGSTPSARAPPSPARPAPPSSALRLISPLTRSSPNCRSAASASATPSAPTRRSGSPSSPTRMATPTTCANRIDVPTTRANTRPRMRALIFDGNLRFDRDHADPASEAGDALLSVRLAGICQTDIELARGYMNFTGIPGHEFVATVADGPPALRGKRVVAEINGVCGKCDMCGSGLSNHCRRRTVVGIAGRDGAFAERLAVPARNCHVLPDTLSDEQAVFVEPL